LFDADVLITSSGQVVGGASLVRVIGCPDGGFTALKPT
jgi:hypothetical protein